MNIKSLVLPYLLHTYQVSIQEDISASGFNRFRPENLMKKAIKISSKGQKEFGLSNSHRKVKITFFEDEKFKSQGLCFWYVACNL